jgi:hypothetical protein
MNSALPELRIDWATHQAAALACKRWHYSRTLPAGALVKVGAWEGSRFVGCVIFAHGASAHLGDPYGLKLTECCELCRVALREHAAPVSRIIALALRFLRKQSPGLRLVISFADPVQGHHGGIYQAGGWLYTGQTGPGFAFKLADGKQLHKKMFISPSYGKAPLPLPVGAKRVDLPGKHRYLYPFDEAMRAAIEPLRKPYPKRVTAQAALLRREPAVMEA